MSTRQLFEIVLIVLLVMNNFVLGGCKQSVPGIYLNQKDDKLLSVELKSDGKYRIFSDKGAEAVGEYVVKDNMITFIMFGKENKGEIKEESIIMENGEVWKKKK
jgi:hypothetical protein